MREHQRRLKFDWEYPGLRGNNNVHRPEDKENFTAMMTDLRQPPRRTP